MQKSGSLKIVFDTSAYVAALLSQTGGAAAVFEQVILQNVFNFYTNNILNEVKTVLARPKFQLTGEKQDHFLQLIREVSHEIQQLNKFETKQCRDPSDDQFLSLANQIKADFIISFDKDLLALKRFGKTDIVTPGEFLFAQREY